jgi:NAD(P)-dependent dehydrogenase (short-subunit alcohol dehydrogenase family)
MDWNTTNWSAVRSFVPTLHHEPYPFISPLEADLSGKSVFVTGATRGIGQAIAVGFAQAGCSRIAVGGRGDLSPTETKIFAAARAADRAKPEVLKVTFDVSSEASLTAAASQITEQFGGVLDVLINNAGVVHAMTTLEDSDPEDWWRTWEVNVKGVYMCTRALLPLLLRSRLKTVITVSTAGAHMLTPGLDGYQTGKFAVCRLTEFVAEGYQKQGLIALTVHPGDVLTEIASNVTEEVKKLLVDKPELAGHTVVWLARVRREWLSGRFVNCCWDMAELERRRDDLVNGDLLKFRMTV